MSNLKDPLTSLSEGHWFKLICGASFQHLQFVRNITLAYCLAGADCIDVAADPAVIAAAVEAIEKGVSLGQAAQKRGSRHHFPNRGVPRPLLMVSLNDGEDPHFRKAEFNPEKCPPDCPRPCESICPAQAIAFPQLALNIQPKPGDLSFKTTQNSPQFQQSAGVIEERCYGCGRCLPVCPIGQIVTRSYVSTPTAIAPSVLSKGVNAVEIHTQVGRIEDFKRLWSAVAPSVNQLKVVAISCPDGENLIDYLWTIYHAISPVPCALIWQTDGRPMSGDIGIGTTRAAIKLGQKVLAAGLPGFVQLAGGTNQHTVSKLKSMGLLRQGRVNRIDNQADSYLSGVAYGSYARVLLSPILERLEQQQGESFFGSYALEDCPDLLWQAVSLADSLVSELKFGLQLQNNTNNTRP
ncbi:circadian clock protein LdpA [Laspinema olomoucense]|uniref:circadian clock protein LdpA n=1 Tax=Laspinema olomoucense TaxID=3231600 RepID=UPI0021BAAE25|nr:LdpA C-terminal domain-containing domain [Laspinema sp. D3d]MCT7972226.1 4Fe-4S binding protein [Laspinema sp. D3d]